MNSLPETIVCVTIPLLFLLLAPTLGQHLPLVHLCDLQPYIVSAWEVFECTTITHLLRSCRIIDAFVIPDPKEARKSQRNPAFLDLKLR